MRKIKNLNQKGFTLVELLVCLFLSMLIVALLCQTIIVNNNLYSADIVRTSLNQDLKNAMAIISADVKEAGENLAKNFPAVELRQDATLGTSILTIRRNMLDEILKVCEPIAKGSTVSEIKFSLAGTTSGCIYSDNIYNFDVWKQYRLQHGNIAYPFIYDMAENKGEFFTYKGESDTSAEHSLIVNSFSASNDYNVGASAMYMVEEWQFFLQDGFLVLIENGQTHNPKKIINNVKKFLVNIETEDGVVHDTFLPESGDMWSDIATIHITIGNEKSFMKKMVEKELSASFYPRNILSH
ncbi:MAG: PilW family protein [Bdellovibrionota bacterium]